MNIRPHPFVVCLSFGLALLACDSIGADTPGRRVLQAMELIRDGKPKPLEDYVLRKDVPGTGFFYGLLSSALAEKGGVTRFELESEKIDGDRASVRVHWHYNTINLTPAWYKPGT